MPDMETFSVKIPIDDPEEMRNFNAMMDALQDEMQSYAEELAQDLCVSIDCAMDVLYLRGRSRWTEELEAELISLHKRGIRPNMNEFGH